LSLNFLGDGLILNPNKQPYEFGQAAHLFKYKKPTEHTVDFRAGVGQQEGQVHLRIFHHGKEEVRYTVTMSPEELKRLHLGNSKLLDKQIVECRYLSENQSWHIERIRYDKTVPNNSYTLTETLKHIQENIQPQEVYEKLSLQ
jgi:hypothetical protein